MPYFLEGFRNSSVIFLLLILRGWSISLQAFTPYAAYLTSLGARQLAFGNTGASLIEHLGVRPRLVLLLVDPFQLRCSVGKVDALVV